MTISEMRIDLCSGVPIQGSETAHFRGKLKAGSFSYPFEKQVPTLDLDQTATRPKVTVVCRNRRGKGNAS